MAFEEFANIWWQISEPLRRRLRAVKIATMGWQRVLQDLSDPAKLVADLDKAMSAEEHDDGNDDPNASNGAYEDQNETSGWYFGVHTLVSQDFREQELLVGCNSVQFTQGLVDVGILDAELGHVGALPGEVLDGTVQFHAKV